MFGDFESTNSYGYSVNICNDTVILCLNEKEEPELYFDSSVIYRNGLGHCTRLTGTYFKNKANYSYLTYKSPDKFEYISSGGDKCGISNETNITYKTIYNFFHKKIEGISTIIDNRVPNVINEQDCFRTINITFDFGKKTDHLLIQKFCNNYWYFTGLVFFVFGAYLLVLAQNKKVTKFIVGMIFGEILIFTGACGIFGLKYEHMEWPLFVVGFFIGGFLGYFSLKNNKLYRKYLSITAGFIFGLTMFDIIFLHQNFQLTEILLTDSILIFMGLFFIIIYLLPEYHYFCDSIIGSYLFIRGISILFYKLGKYARYRELQLILYLINNMEFDYAKYYYDEKWPVYYIYDIFIFLFMIASMIYYSLKVVGKDDDEDEEEEKNPEQKLIGSQKTTFIDEDIQLD